MQNEGKTIVASATAPGTSAIAIVRLSGDEAISIADRVFRSAHGKALCKAKIAYHSSRSYCAKRQHA